ncbi:DUF3000 domain-containing protein [Leucobacter komagatae]|uniref:DUF3000 family protein n=1 Tax=Leucobacter komagatae TaxID=55969 RepID=A0A0D0IPF4_9MICO|nr:DUF3000 domain-containing protein [Leucobacter komagatae]KIP52947.1 hypothetical protein SD72_05405 [Leucobacter komagatae]
MSTPPTALPADFASAAEMLRDVTLRNDLAVREIAPPERIAPLSIAFAAGVRDGSGSDPESVLDSAAGAGRFVLMHDPASAEEWGGDFRIICYAQAPLELEIGVDPFISDVSWSWLIDALDSRGAQYSYISGTATKVLSSSFGALEARGDGAQIELRASWTPLGTDVVAHFEAWAELLCLLAGLPHEEGVASLTQHRVRAQRSADSK